MIDRLEQDLSTLRSALGVRGHRQELLASNIANADTPHFKARDIDFSAALANALGCAGADAAGANRSVSVRVAHMKLPLVRANTPPNTTLSASRTQYRGR